MERYMPAIRVLLIFIFIPVGALLVFLGVLLALSPGKAIPFLDERGEELKGSISEKTHIFVRGFRQGMFIKGMDVKNPVLLFLHGGTAMPEYFLTQQYPTGLEEYFTVCWWDRLGAGLSWDRNIPKEAMTLEQAVSDTIEVADYLRRRFGKEKIYLMAHSGGSIIGIQAAAEAPGLFAAYMGVGQMTHQIKSEKLSWEYMLQRYREQGNRKMVKQLESGPVTTKIPLPDVYMKVRDKAMHELGVGTIREMRSVMGGIFLSSWLFREYTLREKHALWKGKFSSDKFLWDTMIAMDLTKRVKKLDLPVYFFHGAWDYTVSLPLARAYLDTLQAPVKDFFVFEHSAHSPMFEEPARMKEVFVKYILPGF